MRKQSWQMRLIPLFYSTGIIKGLSNNNYAHKVDTLLSCSRWEWQPGVRDRKMGKAAWECKCGYHRVGICVQKGDVKLAGNPIIKTSHNPIVTYQHRTHARKFKAKKKKDIYNASSNSNSWDSPPHTLYIPTPRTESGSLGWAEDNQESPSWRLRGVDIRADFSQCS